MYPIINNLSEMSDEELIKKISDIYQRLPYYGNNQSLMNQLYAILETYKAEQARRYEVQRQEAHEKMAGLRDKIRIR